MLPHRSLPAWLRLVVPFLLLGLCPVPLFAGVTVLQNTGPGATSWPGTPLLSSAANPQAQLTVTESFGGATTTSYGQSFTITGGDSYRLQSICLYAGGGTGTTEAATVRLNLYRVTGVAPDPSSYAAGNNLLGGGAGLPIAYTTQPNGILRFDFTGEDQVRLLAGYQYVFELTGVAGTTPLNWSRSAADTYAGGAAYRGRAWINTSNARDFGLAVYGSVDNSPLPPTECTVDAGVVHQQIDGFGAGVVFLYDGQDPLPEAQMDQLYGTGPGQFGLTLIRVRISPDGNFANSVINGSRAHARGARILATPWTPPASMKSNASTIHGYLLPEKYPDYVAYLNQFLATMSAGGAPVSVVSLQNEPDYDPDYEGCQWSAAQFQTFCRDFAGGIAAPVMMPEAFGFSQTVSDATLNDPAAAANVDYIGGHLYGATIRDYPLARAKGKPIWMTEYLVNEQTIGSAVGTAQQIVDCLTVGNMSAYIWWKCIGTANGLLDNDAVPQRRGYVMGQFSRFARPGDYRIGVADNTGPLGITAFVDPASGRVAIVAVNTVSVPVQHRFKLAGLTLDTVTPWVTSASQSLEAQSAVAVAEGTFTYTLPASSVVTFAGRLPHGELNLAIATVAGQPGQYRLRFGPVRPGWTYTPEYCTDLDVADWQELTGCTEGTIGSERTLTGTVDTGPRRFYRIRTTPAP